MRSAGIKWIALALAVLVVVFRAELRPGDYFVDADIREGAPAPDRIPLRIGVAPAYLGK